MNNILKWIKQKIAARKKSKAEKKAARDKMFARMDAPKYVRDGLKKGEVIHLTFSKIPDAKPMNLMYLYSMLDEDYWMDMETNVITSILQKHVQIKQ